MSITFNNPALNKSPSKPLGHPSPSKDKPEDPHKKFERERLQRQLEQTKQRLKKLEPISKPIRVMAEQIAHTNIIVADEDPQYLLTQITPILRTDMKVPLTEVRDNIELSEKKGKDSLYHVPLRRDLVVDGNMIAGFNRKKMNFNALTWSNKGFELWIKYPYEPPPEEQAKMPKLPKF